MKALLKGIFAALLFIAPAAAQQNTDSQVQVNDSPYGQLPAAQLWVTPTGGSRIRLGDALAASGGCTTNCTIQTLTVPTALNATGTTTTAGIADSGGINTTVGYQIGGSLILNSLNSGQTLLIGLGAGVGLPAGDNSTVAIGQNALQVYGAIKPEIVAVGWGSMRSLTGGPWSANTTAPTTASTVITVDNIIGVVNGWAAVAIGIPAGTTVVSSTGNTITLSQNVTVASGVNVQFAAEAYATTAATTGGNVLTFAATTNIITTNVAFGGGISGFANVISTTGTTVTLDRDVTVASGATVYFATKTGQFNTTLGLNTMGVSTQDSSNTIVGNDGMRDAIGSNNATLGTVNLRDGNHNNDVAIGSGALASFNLTSAATTNNVAIGQSVMGGANLTTASYNVGIGTANMQFVSTALNNVGIGRNTLSALTTGGSNVGSGYLALQNLTTGNSNVASGPLAMQLAVTAGSNVAVGGSALGAAHTNAFQFNTAVGSSAMGNWDGSANATNNGNVGIGVQALMGATGSTVSASVGIGARAGVATTTAFNLTLIGANSAIALTSGNNNTVIGANVAPSGLTTFGNNILIGSGVSSGVNLVDSSANNTINIGNIITATGTNVLATSVTTVAGLFNAVGVYEANGTTGVSCAANSVVLTTLTVTNGIVTHC